MKKICTFLAALLVTGALAQAPQKMTYQAVIRDPSNLLLPNTTVGMRISILQGSVSGTPVYVELQFPTSNANGLVTCEIGGGAVVTGTLSAINWANGPYFIKTETDPAGGTAYTITGTSQLLSVPYALYAETSATALSVASAWNLGGNTTLVTPAAPATYGTSPIGGPENWLGAKGANDLVFGTNGIERMRILQNGNIGFGTAAPSYPLHGLGSSSASIQVVSNTNSAGIGITGQNTAAPGTGTGIGIFGATQQSAGFGLYGANLNTAGTGILGIGNNVSSYTLPSGGAGGAFYGNLQGVYGYVAGNGGYGVYGKAVNSTSAYGVVGMANNVTGSAPTQGAGGAFMGNSYGLSAYQFSTTGQTAGGYFIAGDGAGGAFSTTLVEAFSSTGTHYKIWQNVVGTVSTAVPDLNGKPATLHAPETPEFYFQDFGQGALVNGKAHIELDPIFAKNVVISDKHPLRVFIQLEGDENCKGVVVKNKTATGFDVVELSGGTSNATFQWFVTCNVADAKIGNRVSRFSDLRFEPGPETTAQPLEKK
jgi:hypothetical protein